MTNKHKQGRPTIFTKELADEICSQLANGDSMRTVCKPDSMPCKTTLFMWMRTNEAFLNQYTRAKQESADALTDEMLDIADDASNDWMERLDKDEQSAGWQLNGDHVQRSRLRIETRKWLSAKLKPKKYGDKLFQETKHSGIVGVREVGDMSDEEMQEELRQINEGDQ
ncbi:MAG: hypothetical protein V3T88_08765 [Nitrosomonadaceae bacterium]